MEFTPLMDPFPVQLTKEGIDYEVKVTYAKSKKSCANFFNVEVSRPAGIEPFCLRERPIHDEEQDSMLWIDEEGRVSSFYQEIGERISRHLSGELGIFLLDTPLAGERGETENS